MEAGRHSEAVAPLQRAVEVASAYFPESAGREKALCHSAYGRCLWYMGRFADAAEQFQAGGGAAARARGLADEASLRLAEAHLVECAARARFEGGHFDAAASLAAEATAAGPRPLARLIIEAVQAVNGVAATSGEMAAGSGRDWRSDEAIRRTNLLVARALPDAEGDYGAALDEELAEGCPLAKLLEPGADEGHTLQMMALRSTVGQLAVAAKGSEVGNAMARSLLSAALKDFEVLQPGGPTYKPLYFRTLGALGELLGNHEPVTAEGLYRSAVDQVEGATHGAMAVSLRGKRGTLWRAQVFNGFAELLAEGRRAEQRATEIADLRARAADALGVEEGAATALSRQQLRWALVWLPPPERLMPEELGL